LASPKRHSAQAGPEWHDRAGLVRVRRQHLWEQIGDLSNGGFLAHRNPKENEDGPEIPCPTRCTSVLNSMIVRNHAKVRKIQPHAPLGFLGSQPNRVGTKFGPANRTARPGSRFSTR
jgi:hypothetical protein